MSAVKPRHRRCYVLSFADVMLLSVSFYKRFGRAELAQWACPLCSARRASTWDPRTPRDLHKHEVAGPRYHSCQTAGVGVTLTRRRRVQISCGPAAVSAVRRHPQMAVYGAELAGVGSCTGAAPDLHCRNADARPQNCAARRCFLPQIFINAHTTRVTDAIHEYRGTGSKSTRLPNMVIWRHSEATAIECRCPAAAYINTNR